MFPRSKRLSRANFPTPSRGRRFSSEHFSITLPLQGEGYAVVIPKKIYRLSVTRHRLKRRINAILRTKKLPLAAVVYPKASAAILAFKEMENELSSLIDRIPH